MITRPLLALAALAAALPAAGLAADAQLILDATAPGAVQTETHVQVVRVHEDRPQPRRVQSLLKGGHHGRLNAGERDVRCRHH